MRSARDPSRLLAFLGATFLLVFLWSAIGPKDRGVWWLEVFPAIIGAVVLLAIYGRLRVTPILYVLIWVHALVLLVGGHYTYAEVPLFNWIRDSFGLARNHYDLCLTDGGDTVIAECERLRNLTHLAINGFAFLTIGPDSISEQLIDQKGAVRWSATSSPLRR
jgi:hypothetical protein